MTEKEINEKLLDWLNEPKAKEYFKVLEESKQSLTNQLETATEDHRYIQGNLAFCKKMIAFKDVLENYLNEENT